MNIYRHLYNGYKSDIFKLSIWQHLIPQRCIVMTQHETKFMTSVSNENLRKPLNLVIITHAQMRSIHITSSPPTPAIMNNESLFNSRQSMPGSTFRNIESEICNYLSYIVQVIWASEELICIIISIY